MMSSTGRGGLAVALAAPWLTGGAFTLPGGGLFQTQQAWARASDWAAAAKREAMNAASKWRPAWAVLAGYAPVSARLHLALFYFYGVYYHWAKRATGAAHPHTHLAVQLLYCLDPSLSILHPLLEHFGVCLAEMAGDSPHPVPFHAS